jgi:membrane protease YdiL (CAAX protease family)
MNKKALWTAIALLEILTAVLVIVLDLFIPTIVILGMIAVSLLIRQDRLATLGFHKAGNILSMLGTIFLFVLGWQLFQIGLVMPLLNRLTGTTQDLSAFANLKGNLPNLLFLLAISWTLAAFGEEIVYRGYLQRRLQDVFGTGQVGLIIAVGISSILFGIAHTEQGLIGVVLTTLDALFFSWLKRKYKNNLWAAVLAHGFSNTIGLVTFFFTGPIYGLW